MNHAGGTLRTKVSSRMLEQRHPRIRYRHWVFRLPFMRRYSGMVVGRLILFRDDKEQISPALLRHELVHQEQIDRHGIPRFYFSYFREYVINLWRLRGHYAAYRTISFEKEAYERELLP